MFSRSTVQDIRLATLYANITNSTSVNGTVAYTSIT